MYTALIIVAGFIFNNFSTILMFTGIFIGIIIFMIIFSTLMEFYNTSALHITIEEYKAAVRSFICKPFNIIKDTVRSFFGINNIIIKDNNPHNNYKRYNKQDKRTIEQIKNTKVRSHYS